jgi:hypothetical protein
VDGLATHLIYNTSADLSSPYYSYYPYCKTSLLSFDEHVNVTGEDKSADVLYIKCVAKPSTSQDHTPG